MCAVASLYLYYNMSYLNFQASLAKIFIYEIIQYYKHDDAVKFSALDRETDMVGGYTQNGATKV